MSYRIFRHPPGSYRALLTPIWSFTSAQAGGRSVAAMRLSLGLEISQIQAEMALGMR